MSNIAWGGGRDFFFFFKPRAGYEVGFFGLGLNVGPFEPPPAEGAWFQGDGPGNLRETKGPFPPPTPFCFSVLKLSTVQFTQSSLTFPSLVSHLSPPSLPLSSLPLPLPPLSLSPSSLLLSHPCLPRRSRCLIPSLCAGLVLSRLAFWSPF